MMTEMNLEQKIERALDYQEIQNLMSKHFYYQAVKKNREELDDLWVKKTPNARWTNDRGSWVGMESIKSYMVEISDYNRQKELERIIQQYPEVENKKENWMAGQLELHPLTTPVIEIAGDGKTAKGLWYSPGMRVGIGADGKPKATWVWEKYAVSFVKEDGKWKIWRLHMYNDFGVPVGESWADPTAPPEATRTDRKVSMPNEPPKVVYNKYSPTTVPQFIPKPPEPYETFDEMTENEY